jgi:hypothetical protein
MFTEIEHLIKEMIETIGKIRQNRETNSSAVKEQQIFQIANSAAGTLMFFTV